MRTTFFRQKKKVYNIFSNHLPLSLFLLKKKKKKRKKEERENERQKIKFSKQEKIIACSSDKAIQKSFIFK